MKYPSLRTSPYASLISPSAMMDGNLVGSRIGIRVFPRMSSSADLNTGAGALGCANSELNPKYVKSTPQKNIRFILGNKHNSDRSACDYCTPNGSAGRVVEVLFAGPGRRKINGHHSIWSLLASLCRGQSSW